MINTLKIFEELKEIMEENSAKKLTEIFGLIYEELDCIIPMICNFS